MIERNVLESHPIKVGEQTYKLHTEAITLDLPFMQGVWQRPTKVEDLLTDNVVPVIDTTRWLTWGFVSLTVVFGVIGSLIGIRKMRRKRSDDKQ